MPTVNWAVDADGDWSDAADWSPMGVPNSSDDVTINTTDLHTITYSTGVDKVHSLTVGNDDFVMSGGHFIDTGAASFANLLTISGGRMVFSATGESVTFNSFDWSGGTLMTDGNIIASGPAVISSTVSLFGAAFQSLNILGSTTLDSGANVTVGTGMNLQIEGSGSTFAGTVGGAGTLSFAGGTQTLNSGTTIRTSNWDIYAAATVTLHESLTYNHIFLLANSTLNLNGHTLNLTGSTELDDATVNGVGSLITHGPTSASNLICTSGNPTWDNFGTLTAGTLNVGTMAVVNNSTGVFNFTGDTSVGALSLTNDGLFEKTGGTGKIVVVAPVDNLGTLLVSSGTLTFFDAVTGTGGATIMRGNMIFDAGFVGNVDFTGTNGRLVLAQSQGYTGTVSGFSTTGGTLFDLKDIGFVSAGEATFSGTPTGGTLTVTDGTHTASIMLTGDYLGSTFTASSDGSGGTIVIDPAPAQGGSTHAFVAAMAALAAPAAAAIHAGLANEVRAPLLSRPHAMSA